MLAKGRWDMFRPRRSAKWPLWYFQQRRSFAACRGVLTLRLEANGVLGAIPAGSRAAPAGGTCPTDLSSVRFSSESVLTSSFRWSGAGSFFSPRQVPCLYYRSDGLRARLPAVTEGGGCLVLADERRGTTPALRCSMKEEGGSDEAEIHAPSLRYES